MNGLCEEDVTMGLMFEGIVITKMKNPEMGFKKVRVLKEKIGI